MSRLTRILILPVLAVSACGGGESPLATQPVDSSTSTVVASTEATTGPGSSATSVGDFYLTFDGRDDGVLVPWDESFPTEVFTAAASVRLGDSPDRRAAIIARGEDGDSWDLSWQLFVANDGTLQVMIETSNMDNYCYPGNDCVAKGECTSGDLFIADGSWHHVAVTRDSESTLVFYIDGEERARCTSTGVPSSDNHQFLSIGATFGAIGPPPDGVEPPIWFLEGDIDNAALWDMSLSGAEIESLAANGVNLRSIGLVGHWNFNGGTGQTVTDGSPVGNDGFLGAVAASDSADPVWND